MFNLIANERPDAHFQDMNNCADCGRLRRNVDEALEKLIVLMGAQRDAFLENNHAEFMRLDKEVENGIGHKERCVGALQEHNEHEHAAPRRAD